MPDLRIVSVSTVRPARNDRSSHVRIELTPWDLSLLCVEYTQRGLVFPQPISSQDIVNHLKATLSSVLDVYFPLAGRLVEIEDGDERSSFYISCNASGVRFVHSISECLTVADILSWGSVSDSLYRPLFPMNGVKSFQGVSEPLLAVQVTQLHDGLFVAFGFNHLVADGSSFWRFVEDWSKFSACSDYQIGLPSDQLVLKRWFLEGVVDPPIPIPSSCCVLDSSLSLPLQERVFHFTKDVISGLKAKSNEEAGRETEISSFQALVAHLWRSITSHRGLDPDQELHCRFLVDMRQRLNPPMHKESFGNVVQFGSTTATVKELLGHGLGWAASKINKTVASQTDREARKFADDWARNPRIPNLGQGNTSMVVAGSPRFRVYGCDFGWGPPEAVRAGPGNNSDGKLVMFPGVEGGSVDVQVCLSPETLKALEEDEGFMAELGLK